MKTVTVAGGGLAGLALGLALRRRTVSVQVLEASIYPRHRVCGEFVSGIGEQEIRELGLEDIFAQAARPRETAWFDGAKALLRAPLPDIAYGMSRHLLDHAMAERFQAAGGWLKTGERFSAAASEAEGVVLATGRPRRASSWIGLKTHFTDLPLLADLEMHLGRGAYVGLTSVEQGRVNVSGLFRQTSALSGGPQALAHAVRGAGLEKLAERLLAAQADASSVKGVSHFHLGWQMHRDDAVRIGDAAAIIPPFTGNGMAMALQSGLIAAEPLAAWSRGELTWSEARRRIARMHRKVFARRLWWARGLQAVLLRPWGRRVCARAIMSGWLSFEYFYRKVR